MNEKRKVIAIDLNDVIREYTKTFAKLIQRFVNENFDPDTFEPKTFEFWKEFGFETKDEYLEFVYVDFSYELFGCANGTHRNVGARFNIWTSNDLMDIENYPEFIIVSPFEQGLTIQSTFFFLSKLPCRIREIYFPKNSATIWDKCDILITANPNLVKNCPEGKTVIKIDMSYNQDAETRFHFPTFMDVMDDPKQTVIKLFNGEEIVDDNTENIEIVEQIDDETNEENK